MTIMKLTGNPFWGFSNLQESVVFKSSQHRWPVVMLGQRANAKEQVRLSSCHCEEVQELTEPASLPPHLSF